MERKKVKKKKVEECARKKKEKGKDSTKKSLKATQPQKANLYENLSSISEVSACQE